MCVSVFALTMLVISFSPCGVLKLCVYCVPFSSQSGGDSGVCGGCGGGGGRDMCVRVCMGGIMFVCGLL